MPIQTSCPGCAKVYNLADAMQGKNVKCKSCAQVFLVTPVAAKTATAMKTPKAATTPAPPTKAAPKKTSPKPAEDDVMDVLPAEDDDDDDDDVDDRPARKGSRKSADPDQPKKKSRALLWVLLAGGGGVGFLLLIGCVGGLWYFMGGGGNAIDEANYEKLRTGMTEAEVQAILGKPTKNLDMKNPFGFGGNPVAPNAPDLKTSIWEQKQNSINVTFENGKVTMFFGSFKTPTGSKQLSGVQSDRFAQAPPPPQPQNPPPQNPPPKSPPPNNPPPAGGGPSKMTEGGAFLLNTATDKNNLTFFSQDDPPTNKTVGNVVTPNGKRAAEYWTWTNGKGYLKIYFDKSGTIIDRESKDLPKM